MTRPWSLAMDSLHYHYDAGSNRLNHVTDGVNSAITRKTLIPNPQITILTMPTAT